jgi:FkbH-like protein
VVAALPIVTCAIARSPPLYPGVWSDVTQTKASLDDLLGIGNLGELRAAVVRSGLALSLPQAQRLAAHAETLESAAPPLRLGIIHTYTSDLLDPWLALAGALQGVKVHIYHAPYGLALQEAHAHSGLVAHKPDLTLLLLQREDLHPDLARPLGGFDPEQQDELRREVRERLLGIVAQFRAHPVGQLVITLLPSALAPGLGVYDAQSERSESAWWARLKADVAQGLRESVRASLFLDLDEVLQHLGRASFFDRRYWYSARFPFTTEGAREISRRVVGLGAISKFPRAKVIVLDADNTLWGGIIGEDGMNGIALGPDYPGNTFVDFQRRLLAFQQRGFILALCSKNNPADVDQVFAEHPHQVLQDRHFAARRVNWLPKVENLVALAEELNLGLDSFVFVDDSPHECAAVRHGLPQVEVIQTPERPVDIPGCLDHVARLEVLSLTAEDLAKTDLYAEERQRRESREVAESTGTGLQEYLASLKMRMRVGLDESEQVARLSQLTQKTNQFNLTTRRYDEQQIQELIRDPSWVVAQFSLADVFGDSGLVGLALFHIVSPQSAELDTFLMSCRVIGREAESAFLEALLRHLAGRGVAEVLARYESTKKNDLVKDFLPEQAFEKCADGRYRRDLRKVPPKGESAFPITIELGPSA